MTGTSTDLTLTVGTPASTANIVTGWDFDAAAVGTYAPVGSQANLIPLTTATTVDITISAQTGTFLTGKIYVGVVVVDTTAAIRPGLAPLGS
jgi:homoserine kinase